MKKAIVLGAAMLLAGAAAFAADEKKGPAIKFSGKLRTGYVFDFAKDKSATAGDYSSTNWKGNGGRLNFHVTDAEGAWDLNYKNIAGDLDSNDKEKITATVNFDKLMDLGDFKVKMEIGNKTDDTALFAYADRSGDHLGRVKLVGDWITALQVASGDLTVRAAVDPVYNDAPSATKNHAGFAASASYKLADYGLNVAADYAYHGQIEVADGKNDVAKIVTQHVIGVSANFDLGKVLKADGYKLGLSGVFNYGIGNDKSDRGYYSGTSQVLEDNYMVASAELSGGVDLVDGFVEYSFVKSDADDADAIQHLYAQANLNMFEDKGVGLDVYGKIGNFDDADKTWAFGGDASYTLKAVEFGLNGEVYAFTDTAGDKSVGFSVTPKMTIVW
jgi:hypothetical protein